MWDQVVRLSGFASMVEEGGCWEGRGGICQMSWIPLQLKEVLSGMTCEQSRKYVSIQPVEK